MKKITFALLLLALLTSCTKITEGQPVGSSIRRTIDDEAGVACWTLMTPGGGGGISCLPISETRLETKENK